MKSTNQHADVPAWDATRPPAAATGPTVRPPGPCRATRIPAPRSRANHRGQIRNTLADRPMVFESGLERDVGSTLVVRRDVLDLWDQPPAVRYVDPEGDARRITADYLATLVDGRRVLIFVKPSALAERQDLDGFLRHLAPQVPTGFATDVVAMDERDVPRDLVARARLLASVRRTPTGPIDGLMSAMVAALRGGVAVADLVAQTGAMGSGGRAFRAVVRQIDQGALRVVHGAHVGHRTLVAPTVVHGAAGAGDRAGTAPRSRSVLAQEAAQ